jgi:hypothetical protein
MPHAPTTRPPLSRRDWLRAASLAAAALVAGRRLAASPVVPPAPRTVIVYKDPDCGCCTLWNDHMRAAGFTLQIKDTRELAMVKASVGVPAPLQSCHTGVVGGYFVEGHVPADLVVRLLAERPAIAGLAVPGMPIGSPGMEGTPPARYDILAVGRDGATRVYATRMGRAH